MSKAMKNALVLGASMLFAISGAAFAGRTTTISLNDRCDVLTINRQEVLHVAYLMTDDANCEALFGAGLTGTDKFFGKIVTFGAQAAAYPGRQFEIEVGFPYVTGGSYAMYYTTDGVKLNFIESGTYTVGGASAHKPGGGRPALAAMQQ